MPPASTAFSRGYVSAALQTFLTLSTKKAKHLFSKEKPKPAHLLLSTSQR
jgi:hypothetical protein